MCQQKLRLVYLRVISLLYPMYSMFSDDIVHSHQRLVLNYHVDFVKYINIVIIFPCVVLMGNFDRNIHE